ncbi:hypothetical protein FKX85_19330 [Echinicola soli]|uniref:Uncharacterized protein n=1 Tax=Echinicola soli TaxID=2591634 RepID=A0A514CMM2_9BACT|nr:hypothetical protein [Echinicola soli]QDH81072.1 hypothetical protein FKX85_19330 [Echinicola soli]
MNSKLDDHYKVPIAPPGFPELGAAMTDGEVAFRQHAGGHSTGPNWSTWIAWASRYWDHN